MKRLSVRWFGSIGVLAFLMVPARGAGADDLQFSAKVKVAISAAENLKGPVSSYLNRELRSLNDVEIVDDNSEWNINVIAMDLQTIGGYKSGVALSAVIFDSFDNKLLLDWFQPKFKEIGANLTSGLSYHPDLLLKVGSADHLQELCKAIVVDFDAQILEKYRKEFRRMNRAAHESKSSGEVPRRRASSGSVRSLASFPGPRIQSVASEPSKRSRALAFCVSPSYELFVSFVPQLAPP